MSFFDLVEARFHDWHYDHPRILYALMRSLKPQVAVEVGTYRGYAACYMARALEENGAGHLYCIDDFSEGTQKKYDAAHWADNLAVCRLTHRATLVVGKSSEVLWPDKVDFAYIDGWHGYETVMQDFNNCAIRGAECVCLDDATTTVGPMLGVDAIRRSGRWDVIELYRDCGLAVCMRKQPRPRPRFSQELQDNAGVVLCDLTEEGRATHFERAREQTGISYEGMW